MCVHGGGGSGPREGVPAPGGGACSQGGSGPGGCLVDTPQTATAAGGTHPTGMHSCVVNYFEQRNLVIIAECSL